jgi:hypothetical protein
VGHRRRAGEAEDRLAGYTFRGWAEAEGLIIKLGGSLGLGILSQTSIDL